MSGAIISLMKFAILSDIHGNLPALRAVTADIQAWQPDQVIVNGDIVNRGPCSRDCLHFVLEKQATCGWHLLRGNHEDYILYCANPDFETEGPGFEVTRFAYWVYQQLNGEIEFLRELPDQYSWYAPDGSELRVVHGSMLNNRDGIYKRASDELIREQIAPAPALFATAHTHQPLIRQVDETLVVNTGSVGSPFDRDQRPSYGRITWNPTNGWQAEIKRVPYDLSLIEADYVASGFLDEGGPLAQLMLIELRKARGLIFRWAYNYEDAVRAGNISMEESVRRIMLEEDVRPYLGAPGWEL